MTRQPIREDSPASNVELSRAARGGAVTLVGSGSSAVLGFVFTVLVARSLGSEGAGVVLQAVAAFTITLSFARLGLDTTAIWLLPTLRESERSLLRQAVVGLVVISVLVSTVVSAVWFASGPWLRGGMLSPDVSEAISVAALFLPAASVMTVSLACTRAFGGVVAFNAIGNILVPLLRVLGVLVVASASGAALGGILSWSVPWLVGAVASLLTLAVLMRRTRLTGSWRTSSAMLRRILRYSLPRTLAAGLEQSVIWLNVLMVGALLGSGPAGVYGAASRFVSAGVIIATALRIVVAPRFSALLSRDRHWEVGRLYRATAQWILLFGSPVYLLFAIFSPTVLGWLGPEFGEGVTTMVTLCLGSVTVLAAGNVQSLLLMSGHSGLGALNKMVVVAANVVGTLILVPAVGILGAALSWAASIALDTALAAYQVRRATGIMLAVGPIIRTLGVVALSVAGPSLLILISLGQWSGQLLAAAVCSGLVLVVYCALDRRRLHLDRLTMVRRS